MAQHPLEACGLSESERLVIEAADAVWCLIDWDGSLWRSTRDVYGRFETRIIATAYQPTPQAWLFALARKCHVNPALIQRDLVARLKAAQEPSESMRIVRTQPGLIVSGIRIMVDHRREKRRKRKERRDDNPTSPNAIAHKGVAIDPPQDESNQPDQPLF